MKSLKMVLSIPALLLLAGLVVLLAAVESWAAWALAWAEAAFDGLAEWADAVELPR